MDTISASSVNGDGKINVNQFNLTSETNNPNIIIDFADETIRDHVGTDISSIEGKIFKYNVGYNPETGQFNFAGGGRNSKGYSPSVMASPVAAQMQGYLTQLNSYDEAFRNMDMQYREQLFAREDVQTFLGEVRTAIKEKRTITGAGLLVPEVFLGLIRENILEYSKLYKHVNLRQIGGNGREVVSGTIPEAVWTDCCGILNELDLQFNDAEVGCWKVAGYFDICNATLQDSDIDLASELLTVLGQAIGFALDKAILYGLGTRMPMGIVTRLAQTQAPADYPATARTWVDLHTSNIAKTNTTGIDLYKWILTTGAKAKGKYSRGERVWVMNETTYTELMANTVAVTAAGTLVSGVVDRMPVVGGIIEVLNFIPDNVIIGGYFDLYTLAERAGAKFATSEHVRFLQDQTVMKGTARYDGQPVIAEGFVAIGLNGATPTAAMTFAADSAN
jgi:HK97 family phage major capsid protein